MGLTKIVLRRPVSTVLVIVGIVVFGFFSIFNFDMELMPDIDMPMPGYISDSYLLSCNCPRFGTGEGKGQIMESVRGCDLYLLCDVTNYSLTYSVCGHVNHMSPDNHFQDLKRLISAANGKAKRITVIMPFLYEGRQHKRSMRESLDCSLALQELVEMGVSNIVCCQPFGCLPNHIVGKGMMRPIKARYPDANIVAIDFDPGASRINQENRLKLMMSNARK